MPNNSIPKVFIVPRTSSELVTTDARFLERFVKHNIDTNRALAEQSPEQADVVILFQDWSFKTKPYIKALEQDPIVRKHSEKLYVVNYDSTVSEGFLPGCYVSLQKSIYDQTRFKPCAYPKTYNEYGLDKNKEPIKYLFSFRGTLHSHPVRPRMYSALKNNPRALMVDNTKAFHSHTDDEKKTYFKELAQSIFVLCPRGTSPNSYRLFETMSMGRCPVIISDEWVEPNGPNWNNCSIRVAEKDVQHIGEILKSRESEGLKLGARALTEWQAHFTEKATYQHYLDLMMELHNTTPAVARTFKQNQKYWRSHRFLSTNQWALSQQIKRKFKHFWND